MASTKSSTTPGANRPNPTLDEGQSTETFSRILRFSLVSAPELSHPRRHNGHMSTTVWDGVKIPTSDPSVTTRIPMPPPRYVSWNVSAAKSTPHRPQSRSSSAPTAVTPPPRSVAQPGDRTVKPAETPRPHKPSRRSPPPEKHWQKARSRPNTSPCSTHCSAYPESPNCSKKRRRPPWTSSGTPCNASNSTPAATKTSPPNNANAGCCDSSTPNSACSASPDSSPRRRRPAPRRTRSDRRPHLPDRVSRTGRTTRWTRPGTTRRPPRRRPRLTRQRRHRHRR